MSNPVMRILEDGSHTGHRVEVIVDRLPGGRTSSVTGETLGYVIAAALAAGALDAWVTPAVTLPPHQRR